MTAVVLGKGHAFGCFEASKKRQLAVIFRFCFACFGRLGFAASQFEENGICRSSKLWAIPDLKNLLLCCACRGGMIHDGGGVVLPMT